MKKTLLLLISLILLITSLSGCEDYGTYTSEEESAETEEMTDMEIILKDGHPHFLGLVSDAQTCWKSFSTIKVAYPMHGSSLTDNTIIFIRQHYTWDGNSAKHILEIEFPLGNTEYGAVDPDTAINIVKEYFPTKNEVSSCSYVDSYKCQSGTNYWTYIAHYSYTPKEDSTKTRDFYIQLEGADQNIDSIWFTRDSPYYLSHKDTYPPQEWTPPQEWSID